MSFGFQSWSRMGSGHGSGSSTLCGTAQLPAEVGHERGGVRGLVCLGGG